LNIYLKLFALLYADDTVTIIIGYTWFYTFVHI
jgi:hypothetical protein